MPDPLQRIRCAATSIRISGKVQDGRVSATSGAPCGGAELLDDLSFCMGICTSLLDITSIAELAEDIAESAGLEDPPPVPLPDAILALLLRLSDLISQLGLAAIQLEREALRMERSPRLRKGLLDVVHAARELASRGHALRNHGLQKISSATELLPDLGPCISRLAYLAKVGTRFMLDELTKAFGATPEGDTP